MKRHWLIIYDIRDERRLRRVAKMIERVAVRVQRSVYEATLHEKELQDLRRNVRAIVEDEDVVSYLPLCERDWSKRKAYGVGAKTSAGGGKTYQIL